MANLSKCPNGHMYDADKTPQCPHCRGGASAFSNTAAAEGFAGAASATGFTATGTGQGGGAAFTAAKTVAFKFPNTHNVGSGPLPGAAPGAGSFRSTPTMPGFATPAGPEAAAPGAAPAQGVFNPAVGWLVALTGPERGRDFRLVAGKNVIGRGEEANVRLGEAGQISRSHATLYYYPKVNEFYVEDHSSHGTYLNGKPIIQRTPVANMDRLELGGTTLLLRALCDSGFIWDEFK